MKDFLVHSKDFIFSPYGVIGLLIASAVWVMATLQRNRLSQIRALPSDKRAEILKREYSTFPRSGLSSEEWIRSRRQLYLFLGFITTVILLAVVAIYALGRAGSDNRGNIPAPLPGQIPTPTPVESPASAVPTADRAPKVVPQPTPAQTAPTPTPSPTAHDSPAPAVPDPARLKEELDSLVSELETQVNTGGAFATSEMSDVRDARERVQVWKETNDAIARRMDGLMKALYGVDSKYRYDVQGTTASSYFWGGEKDFERRQIKKDVTEQLKGLRSIQDQVRRDLILHGGSARQR